MSQSTLLSPQEVAALVPIVCKTFKPLAGKLVGRLTPQFPVSRAGDGSLKWLCSCSCASDRYVVVSSSSLGKNTLSCGCLWKESLLPHFKNFGQRVQASPVAKARQRASAVRTLEKINSDPTMLAAATSRIEALNTDPQAVIFARQQYEVYLQNLRVERGFLPDQYIGTTLQRIRASIAPLTKLVRARDQYKCACCGLKGYEVHHIIPRAKSAPVLWTDPNNLITLCKSCHRYDVHHNDVHAEPDAAWTAQFLAIMPDKPAIPFEVVQQMREVVSNILKGQ